MNVIAARMVACLMGLQVCHGEQQSVGNSASGNIHYAVRGPEEDKRIYLSPVARPEEEIELCRTAGWGNLELHFSPDDAWLVVQDGGSSLGVSFRLFRRDRGVAYKEVDEADIDGKAERIALDQKERSSGVLDHRYMKLIAWSPDSKRFLFSLSGHGGDEKNHLRITGWMGIYDVDSDKITLELSKLNRGAVEKGPAQK